MIAEELRALPPAAITKLSAPLARASIWLRVIAVLLIIQGLFYFSIPIALSAYSAFFIPSFLPPLLVLWAGVCFYQCAKTSRSAYRLGDAALFLRAQRNIRTAVTLIGILLCFTILLLVLIQLTTFFIADLSVFEILRFPDLLNFPGFQELPDRRALDFFIPLLSAFCCLLLL